MMSHRAGAFLVVVLAVAMLAGAARAAEFSADLDLKEPSGTVTLKLHVKGRVSRLEGEEDGQRRIVITDKDAGTATVIDPQAKTYEIIKGPRIAWVDPLYRSGQMKEILTKAEAGTETLDGRSCQRFLYTSEAHKGLSVEVWYATDLEHLVKQVLTTKEGKREMVLRNIKVGPVAVALMKIPEDLERKKTPAEIEAALPSLSEAADAQAPVGRRLSGGGELRVKVDPNRKVKVRVESRIPGESVATVIPCHGGQPRENIGTTPWKLTHIGGRRERTFNADVETFGTAFQVDEVRIKVEKGLCRVKVEQSDKDAQDLYVFGGTSAWCQGRPNGLTITVTGDHQAGPTSTGTLVIHMKAGNKTEEFTLENGKSKTWTFSADQGVSSLSIRVKLGKGGVKVRTQ